jgi:hypothetical protein
MSNGLGAGFFTVSLLVALAGVAVFVALATTSCVVFFRRTSRVPQIVVYLMVAITIGVVGVAGFGILVLFDEASAAAWVFTSTVVLPFAVVGAYLARMTELPPSYVVSSTVMAWGLPFLLGIGVALGVKTGIETVSAVAPGESRQLGIPWIAAACGGLTIILAMLPLSTRLGEILVEGRAARGRISS